MVLGWATGLVDGIMPDCAPAVILSLSKYGAREFYFQQITLTLTSHYSYKLLTLGLHK